MTTYDVTVFREEELWVADIPALSAATDVLYFAELDVEVRDLISGLNDVEPDSFDLRWFYRATEDGPAEPLDQLSQVSTVLAELDVRYDALRREIIGRLSEAGLSRQAIGDVLDVPRQRVDELADAS